MSKRSPAIGARGVILWGPIGYIFRVYDADDKTEFIDYALRHCDLSVEIVDDDAYFYEDEVGEGILDHSPQTLGIE